MFAAVHNRSQVSAWGQYGRAYGEFCGHFWRCQTSCSLVYVAGVALRDISTCFITCQNSFCRAGAILLQRFQKMRCIFCGRRNALATSIVISRSRRSTLDVSCYVFFTNRNVRVASSDDKVQIAWWAWHFLRCAEIDGSLARNIDFEVANFEVHKKTRRKTSILKLRSVNIWGSLAWNARFEAPTCLVSMFWFSASVAVSMGEAACPFEGVKASCNVVLLGRRGTSWHSHHASANVPKVILCGKRNAFAYSTLHTPHTTLHTPHTTTPTLHFTLCTPHFTLTLHTLHSALHTLHSTLHTLHLTLHTRHSVRDSTLYTLHFTLYTPHFTLYTPHSTLYTPHFTLYTLHSALYTPHSTLYTLHFTLYTPHSTLYTLHFALHTSHSTLYTLHFTLHTLHSTLHTRHSTLYTLHSTLYTLHSTLHTLHFTLCSRHSTLYILHSTLYTVQRTSFTKVFNVTAFGFVGCIW